jgi:hypothetical protein
MLQVRMIPRLLPVLCVALRTLRAFCLPADAQASNGSGGSQSGNTFQANFRVVLTDVTVTDRKGDPVRGLKASDFHVFDNSKPEEIAPSRSTGSTMLLRRHRRAFYRPAFPATTISCIHPAS